MYIYIYALYIYRRKATNKVHISTHISNSTTFLPDFLIPKSATSNSATSPQWNPVENGRCDVHDVHTQGSAKVNSKRTIRMFPKIGDFPPKWMVKIMENPIKMGWFGGTIIFGNIHVHVQIMIYIDEILTYIHTDMSYIYIHTLAFLFGGNSWVPT